MKLSKIFDFVKPGVITGDDVQKVFQVAKENSSACGVPLSGEVAGGMHVSAWMITVSFPVLNLLNESAHGRFDDAARLMEQITTSDELTHFRSAA